MEDKINPSHYKGTQSMECFDVLRLIFEPGDLYAFCLGNCFKYLWRFHNKNGIEDLNKANWYLNEAMDLKDEYSDLNDDVYDIMHNLYSKLRKEYADE